MAGLRNPFEYGRELIETGGERVSAAQTLARLRLASSTVYRAIQALDTLGIVREEGTLETVRYRLEDPFFAPWLRWAQSGQLG